MSPVEDDDVIQKFPAKASDYALNIGVLPGRGRCGDNLVNTLARHPSLNLITIYTIAVSQQTLRGRIERKRFHDLLGCPLRGRMFRHVKVDDSPAIMRQDDENEQYFECRRWHDKRLDSDEVFQVQIEKCPPSSRGKFFAARFVFFHGRFRDFNPQLMKFGDYAWRTPRGIGSPHPFYEQPQFWHNFWPAQTATLTQRSPVVTEYLFLPKSDCAWLSKEEGVAPPGPEFRENGPN